MKANPRMLVATDLGPGGELAISAAATWARRHDGGGVILHIARGDSAAHLDEHIRAVAGDMAGRFEQRVEKGPPAETILTVAKDVGAELIVLGGRDEGARWKFGSVAERVVNYAEVPVLVARAHDATGRVLAVSDLSDESVVAIEPAREIARATGTRATVVHCVEQQLNTEASYSGFGVDPETGKLAALRDAEARLRTLAGDGVDIEVVGGSVVPTLIGVAEAHNAELVVVASRCRTGLSRWLLGSVAGALIREIDRTVLVIRRT